MDWQEASDLVDMLHQSITNSLVFPPYMFDFWSIPYLLGKGITLEHITDFIRLVQPLLLQNLQGEPPQNEADEPNYEPLFQLGGQIYQDLRLAGARPHKLVSQRHQVAPRKSPRSLTRFAPS